MQSRHVVPFVYRNRSIRVIQDDNGETWFVAVDVCKVLSIANPRDALSRLDEDEKTTVGITDGLIDQGVSDNNPGTSLNLINEPGLYALILTSRKPEAKAFKRWITHEVLPSLRKHGRYEMERSDSHGLWDAATLKKMDALAENIARLMPALQQCLDGYRHMGYRGAALRLAVQKALLAQGMDIQQTLPFLENTERADDAKKSPAAPDVTGAMQGVVVRMATDTLTVERRTLLIGKAYQDIRDERATRRCLSGMQKDGYGATVDIVARQYTVSTGTVKRAHRFFRAIEHLDAMGDDGKESVRRILNGEIKDAITILPRVYTRQKQHFQKLASRLAAGAPSIRTEWEEAVDLNNSPKRAVID